jgi:hypothetical protein
VPLQVKLVEQAGSVHADAQWWQVRAGAFSAFEQQVAVEQERAGESTRLPGTHRGCVQEHHEWCVGSRGCTKETKPSGCGTLHHEGGLAMAM